MKIIFKWFDFWIGVFIDTKTEVVYIFPVPMLGVKWDVTSLLDWFWKTFGKMDEEFPYFEEIRMEYYITIKGKKYFRAMYKPK